MDDTKCRITVFYGIHDNTDRKQIINLIQGLILVDHLLIDAVQMLAAAEDPIRHDAMRMQHIANLIDHILDLRIAF